MAKRFAERQPADIALSTDDARIIEVSAEAGLSTDYVRPAHLATDTAGKIDTLRDLLQYHEERTGKQYDYLMDLDVVSPLRTLEDLENGFRMLQEDPGALNIFSVSHAVKNPYFNLLEQKEDGYWAVSKKGTYLSRQAAPLVYEMNASFYIYRRRFFTEGLRSATTHASLVYLMPHLCFDMDSLIEFEFLEFLIEQGKLPFTI